MIRRIDHVSIAVRDLGRARAFFVDALGGRELFSSPYAPQKFRWTTIELGTSCFIELIDPLEEDGFVHRFLEKRGEGPHHITIQVDDIQETRRALDAKGIPIFGYSEDLPGWKEMFINPKHAFGTLIQFAEFNPLDWVNPGYIPPSYREFAPPEQAGDATDPVEVRQIESARGSLVEIRQGQHAVRIPLEQAESVVQALRRVTSPGSDPRPRGS